MKSGNSWFLGLISGPGDKGSRLMFFKKGDSVGMVIHTFNPSIGREVSEF